jgi:hypothetical protein
MAADTRAPRGLTLCLARKTIEIFTQAFERLDGIARRPAHAVAYGFDLFDVGDRR